MKREGIIFMSEGGKDYGISEEKPVATEPAEPAVKIRRETGNKNGARKTEAPARLKDSLKKPGEGRLSMDEKSRQFTELDRMHPDIKQEIEKYKAVIKNADGSENELSILDIGNRLFGEYKNVLTSGKISEDIMFYINATDKYLEEQRNTDSGREFESKLFSGLGAGSFENGKVIYELMGNIKEDFLVEADQNKENVTTSARPEPVPFEPDSPAGKAAVNELSQMTGIGQEDVKAILAAAPLLEESGAEIKDILSVTPAPVSGAEGETSVDDKQGQKDDQSLESSSVRSSSGGGAEGIPAPMGSGDYARFDDDGGGRGKELDGDKYKRLKDFLKDHFGWQAMGIYLLMLLALYCGAVYYTARTLEENAERSRAGRSQL